MDTTTNGSQWTVHVIKFLWDQLFELWDASNKVVHGKTHHTSTEAKKACLWNVIETMYGLKDQLMAVDRKYMLQS
eukprot:12006722-Ditylum_brightwellii.AAC.1